MTNSEKILLEALRSVQAQAQRLRPHEMITPEQLAAIESTCVRAKNSAAAERRRPLKPVCPDCGKETPNIIETLPQPDRWCRIRECKACGGRWRTEEMFIKPQRSLR